ncbi:MAG: response regulator transcription factor [Deltaproteobacteria bacterium]|nr:response regulator transcription factor [Deltaproteobacteria bacterium]
MTNCRIVLADDHSMLREGLKSLLGAMPGITVVGEADNGRDAVRLCHELGPDLVIMDVATPELNGIEATRQIVANAAGTKVIALSMHSTKRFVLDMLQAGAVAYLLKNSAFRELAEAIATVRAGRAYISPAVASIVVERVAAPETSMTTGPFKLTPREREVLQLIAEGKKAHDVAAKLHLRTKTVQTHRRNIMAKLNMFTLPELTKYAIQQGLTSLEP